MNTCGSCKHWEAESISVVQWGYCGHSEMQPVPRLTRSSVPARVYLRAGYLDDGTRPVLVTSEEFGCNLFEEVAHV